MQPRVFHCETPEDTFALGERLGERLRGGDVILLKGGLGAGKTLLTKGILSALDFDVDEVTSPSFTLVNLYNATELDVYHIDLWRLDDGVNSAAAVGLGEILTDEDMVAIIEWPEKLTTFEHSGRVINVAIDGDGEDPRTVTIEPDVFGS